MTSQQLQKKLSVIFFGGFLAEKNSAADSDIVGGLASKYSTILAFIKRAQSTH